VIDFAKDQLHLSSPLSLVVVLGACVVWLWRRPASRAPRVALALAALGCWATATPIGAALLVLPLAGPRVARLATPRDAAGVDAVIVLGGGVVSADVGGATGGAVAYGTLLRALEGARVFKAIGARTLVASGGIARPNRDVRTESTLIRDVLVDAGIPPRAILEESQSRTTREQAKEVAALLRARDIRRCVIVTTAVHMPRAMALFRREGLDPVASAAPVRSDRQPSPRWFMPNGESLWVSDEAVYEYAALIYYRARGWM
jgi:uncharacterized SAM-binding protein YcdF (DUF218 family)